MPRTRTVLTLFSVLFWCLPVVRAQQSFPIMGKLLATSGTRSKVLLFRKHLFLFVVGVVSATGWSSLMLKVGLNFPSLQDPTMYSSQLRALLQCARRSQ